MVWVGTFGAIANRSLLRQKCAQYPTFYQADDYEEQYGKPVHDCVGLIKGYLWRNTHNTLVYNREQDVDVAGMLLMCKRNGPIYNIPRDMPGILVFMHGHVGVYIGDGKVIEARGHAYGVVETRLEERPWTMWGMLDLISYNESEDDVMLNEFIFKYGEENVREALNSIFSSFANDGSPSGWAEKEFNEAKEMGITDGSNPRGLATRQEVAIMVKRGKSLDNE